MVRVIDDLLLLSKVGDPDNPIIAAPVDLRRVVDEVVDLTSVAGPAEAASTLRVEATDEPVVALGDADELDRLCANLVSNAVKYTPEGGAVDRRPRAHRPTRSCSPAPTTGIGISPEDQAPARHASSSARPTPPPSPSPAPVWASRSCAGSSTGTTAGSRSSPSSGSGSTFRVFLPAA